MANIITSIRILCSIALFFVSPLSKGFYILYLAAGLSDMLDGPVARKTGTASKFGSIFDSIADIIFVAVCLIKLIPVLEIKKWLYIWIALIVLIKIINIISGLIIYKRIIFLHTVLNKITGALAFILLLTFPFLELRYSTPLVCTVATIAAIQEGHFIRTKNQKYSIIIKVMNVIILNGPMGVGKTAVGKYIAEHTPGTAFIDGDWCLDIHPFVGNRETKEMAVDNILHMIGNYKKCSECKMIVLVWLMDNAWVYNSIIEGIKKLGLEIKSVTLTCDKATITNRWKNDKECPWRTEEWLKISIDSLSYFAGLDNVLDTRNLSIEEVAEKSIK